MRITRLIVGLLLALVVMAVAGPALALASGPSAGDQQYTDPLSGSGSKSSGSSGSSGSGSGSSSSSGSTSSGSSSSGASSAPATTSSSTPMALSSSASGTTSATTSGTVASTTSSPSAGTLPLTGFNAWIGAGLGVALLGTGVAVRRRLLRN